MTDTERRSPLKNYPYFSVACYNKYINNRYTIKLTTFIERVQHRKHTIPTNLSIGAPTIILRARHYAIWFFDGCWIEKSTFRYTAGWWLQSHVMCTPEWPSMSILNVTEARRHTICSFKGRPPGPPAGIPLDKARNFPYEVNFKRCKFWQRNLERKTYEVLLFLTVEITPNVKRFIDVFIYYL